MTDDDRHTAMEAARLHINLTVQDIWLRYLGLGGTGDAFDLDGYLQGVLPLDTPQEDVLAQALTEALTDSYDTYRAPLAPPPCRTTADEQQLAALIHQLLQPPPSRSGPVGDPSPTP